MKKKLKFKQTHLIITVQLIHLNNNKPNAQLYNVNIANIKKLLQLLTEMCALWKYLFVKFLFQI